MSNPLQEALAKADQKAAAPQQETKLTNATSTPARRGTKGLTVYLSHEAHAELKAAAEQEGKLLKDLLREGVNLVLQSYGKRPIA